MVSDYNIWRMHIFLSWLHEYLVMLVWTSVNTLLTLFHPGPHLFNSLLEVFSPSFILTLQVTKHLLEVWFISRDELCQQRYRVTMFVQWEHLLHSSSSEHTYRLQHDLLHLPQPLPLLQSCSVSVIRIEKIVGIQETSLIVNHPQWSSPATPHNIVNCLTQHLWSVFFVSSILKQKEYF